MKKFCESLREHAMKIINLIKKKRQESYENAKICNICKEKFENKNLEDKNIVKLEIIVIKQGNLEVLYIAYVI